jgi:hypothetical protein
VWWICRQLTIAREIACDDYVLHQGSGPRAYALLLATLAGRMQATRALPAPGVSTSKTQLQQRIDMILSTHRNTSPRLAKTRLGLITSAAAAIAALAIYSAPRIVLAQAAPAPAPPEAPATPELPPSAAVNASDLVPAQPPAGLSFSHNAPSPAPLPPDVEPDPKPKARNAPAPPAMAQPRWPAEVQVFPPAPPAHPEFPPGHPPYIVGGQPPVKVPRTPEPPSADASVEERLQRLEKMLQSLLTEQDKKSSALNFYYQHPPSKDLAKQKELVERQAAAAAEEANRAVRELEKQLKLQDERRSAEISQDGFKHRMEALRQARQALERQMQSLDRQIAELERDRARLERNEQRKDQLRLQEREMEKEKQRQRDKHNEDEPGSHDGTTGIIDGSRQWVGLAGTSVAIDAARQWILTTGPAK